MSGLSFRAFGIPVRIEPAFVILALLIGFIGRTGIGSLFLIIAVFLSVLVHELGHALAFRAFGRSPDIVLHGLGGRTAAGGPLLSRGKDIVVTIAGSGTQILVLGIPAARLRLPLARELQSPVVFDALTDLAWVSLVWGFLNLAPILPLDGGRILARGLEIFTRNAMRIAHGVSAAVAGAGAVWGFSQQEPFLGLMGAMLLGLNVRGMSEQRDAPVLDRIREGHALINGGDPIGALHAAEEAARRRPGAVRDAALELAAWAHLARGDEASAETWLAQRSKGTERSGYLAGYSALARGDRDAALVVLERAYTTERPTPLNRLLPIRLADDGALDDLAGRLVGSGVAGAAATAGIANDLHDAGRYADALRLRHRLYDLGLDPAGDAYNVACTYARLGDTSAALEWLARALDHGFDDAGVIDADADLDSLRSSREFTAQRARLRSGPPRLR